MIHIRKRRMKIALLTDTHWGVKKDSQIFHQDFKRFLDEIFFPYCQENQIQTLIHLGDLVHDRRKIGALTLSAIRSDFLNKLRDLNFDSHFIIGNHDCYWTNSNKNNFQKEVVSLYNFKIYEEAEEVKLDRCKILMMPWINKENYDSALKMVSTSKAHVLMGHLELSGFQMYKGIENKGGMSPTLFDKFHVTISGHYHTKSSDKNIHYLGTMSQHTWADQPDIKGFHVFDTTDLSLTFIQNPYRMYEIIEYPLQTELPDIKDKYVKILVKSKDSEQDFEVFKSQLEELRPIEIIVTDSSLTVTIKETEEIGVKDNLQIINSVVTESDCQYPDEVMRLLKEIYLEALNVKV